MPDRSNPHGDDQGTRVGSPDTGDPAGRNQSRGATGAGAEAAEAIHSADGDRDPGDRTALEGQSTGRADAKPTRSRRSGGETGDEERSGSEPLVSRETEHRSGYGGSGGEPVRSSDQREPNATRTAREQMEEDA